ncbi:Ran-binding protein 9 [Pelomyxa schiedti]|nr:Ran-binding protein 9 [Pelomyxa schiedti]
MESLPLSVLERICFYGYSGDVLCALRLVCRSLHAAVDSPGFCARVAASCFPVGEVGLIATAAPPSQEPGAPGLLTAAQFRQMCCALSDLAGVRLTCNTCAVPWGGQCTGTPQFRYRARTRASDDVGVIVSVAPLPFSMRFNRPEIVARSLRDSAPGDAMGEDSEFENEVIYSDDDGEDSDDEDYEDDTGMAHTPNESEDTTSSSAPPTTTPVTRQATAARDNNVPLRWGGVIYYELTVVNAGLGGHIGVGIGLSTAVNGYSQPGWTTSGYGYHGDDGNKFHAAGYGSEWGPTFTKNEVIGCGVDFKTNSIFYTKNGQMLGITFKVHQHHTPMNALCVYVGLHSADEQVELNFGVTKPFVYHTSNFVDDITRALCYPGCCLVEPDIPRAWLNDSEEDLLDEDS